MFYNCQNTWQLLKQRVIPSLTLGKLKETACWCCSPTAALNVHPVQPWECPLLSSSPANPIKDSSPRDKLSRADPHPQPGGQSISTKVLESKGNCPATFQSCLELVTPWLLSIHPFGHGDVYPRLILSLCFGSRELVIWFQISQVHCCCCSVAQSCPTLCNPMGCSMPGFPVLSPSHGVCSNSCPLSWWCHPTVSTSVTLFSYCPQNFPAPGAFPMSRLFPSDGQSIDASSLASVLPVIVQGRFPSGVTGLITLQSKTLSSVFSGTTFWCMILCLVYENVYDCSFNFFRQKSSQSCPAYNPQIKFHLSVAQIKFHFFLTWGNCITVNTFLA